jgi:hypothetical protein
LASRRHGSHHAPDTPFLPVLRPPASCGWPQGAWCVRVPGNPREFRRPEGAGLIHGESALVTSSVLPRSVLSAVIAQRAPRRDPEGFPAAGRDGGNPRESTQKWSGAGRWICTRYCAREPLTVSGSRTEPAGGHKLERVCDLRFFIVRLTRPPRLVVGVDARRSPEQRWTGRIPRGFSVGFGHELLGCPTCPGGRAKTVGRIPASARRGVAAGHSVLWSA